jgi:hypothetical protein
MGVTPCRLRLPPTTGCFRRTTSPTVARSSSQRCVPAASTPTAYKRPRLHRQNYFSLLPSPKSRATLPPPSIAGEPSFPSAANQFCAPRESSPPCAAFATIFIAQGPPPTCLGTGGLFKLLAHVRELPVQLQDPTVVLPTDELPSSTMNAVGSVSSLRSLVNPTFLAIPSRVWCSGVIAVMSPPLTRIISRNQDFYRVLLS